MCRIYGKGIQKVPGLYVSPIIEKPEDWLDLPQLDPTKGFLGQPIGGIEINFTSLCSTHAGFADHFQPLAQAKNLAGQESLLKMMRSNPEMLHEGLKTITRTTIQFVQACADIGIDGIFLAIQHAQSSLLSETEFDEFCLPYDLEDSRDDKGSVAEHGSYPR